MDQEVRQAAEGLLQQSGTNLNAQSPITNHEISHSYSINTLPSLHPDYIISEDLLAGHRSNGRMSNVRRFFCMFVTFDLLLTALMWLICVMLKGENIMKALSEQIVHYNAETSLFDIVLMALCRFVVLLLFYALLYMNHWIIISISTTATCLFLITKVFLYDWPHSSQPVFEVLLVLTSFVLAWGEAWFLDFRVIPQETNASRILICMYAALIWLLLCQIICQMFYQWTDIFDQCKLPTVLCIINECITANHESERAPLIRSYINGLQPSLYTESVGNFYSPMASPSGSVLRFGTEPLGRFSAVPLSKDQEQLYRTLGNRTLQEAWDLSQSNNWKVAKKEGSDIVYNMEVPKVGKVFKLSAKIDMSAKFLLDEMFYHVERIPRWNPTILESHKVQPIDEHTDITYQIAADAMGGMVKSRDFVNLRHWDFIENNYILAFVGTEHPSLPKTDKYIRAINGTSCWVMHDSADSEGCDLHWILNTNLSGWIPQSIKETAFTTTMLVYVKHLRAYISKLKKDERN